MTYLVYYILVSMMLRLLGVCVGWSNQRMVDVTVWLPSAEEEQED